MSDPENDDFTVVFVDSVMHSIRSASRAPDAFQLTSQRSAYSLRVVQEGTSDEVDDGKSDRFWQRQFAGQRDVLGRPVMLNGDASSESHDWWVRFLLTP